MNQGISEDSKFVKKKFLELKEKLKRVDGAKGLNL